MKTLRKRRKETKTDYSKRLKLLKGERPRIVIRRTNKYIIADYVESDEAQDKVVLGDTSKRLLKMGWPESKIGSLKSISATYLFGLYFGKKIMDKNMEIPIIDFGMHRNVAKTRIYSFIKGLIDAGLKIKVEKEKFPEKERIENSNIPFKEIKSKIIGK